MPSIQVLLLLLTHVILICHGQQQARFDELLQQFGFRGSGSENVVRTSLTPDLQGSNRGVSSKFGPQDLPREQRDRFRSQSLSDDLRTNRIAPSSRGAASTKGKDNALAALFNVAKGEPKAKPKQVIVPPVLNERIRNPVFSPSKPQRNKPKNDLVNGNGITKSNKVIKNNKIANKERNSFRGRGRKQKPELNPSRAIAKATSSTESQAGSKTRHTSRGQNVNSNNRNNMKEKSSIDQLAEIINKKKGAPPLGTRNKSPPKTNSGQRPTAARPPPRSQNLPRSQSDVSLGNKARRKQTGSRPNVNKPARTQSSPSKAISPGPPVTKPSNIELPRSLFEDTLLDFGFKSASPSSKQAGDNSVDPLASSKFQSRPAVTNRGIPIVTPGQTQGRKSRPAQARPTQQGSSRSSPTPAIQSNPSRPSALGSIPPSDSQSRASAYRQQNPSSPIGSNPPRTSQSRQSPSRPNSTPSNSPRTSPSLPNQSLSVFAANPVKSSGSKNTALGFLQSVAAGDTPPKLEVKTRGRGSKPSSRPKSTQRDSVTVPPSRPSPKLSNDFQLNPFINPQLTTSTPAVRKETTQKSFRSAQNLPSNRSKQNKVTQVSEVPRSASIAREGSRRDNNRPTTFIPDAETTEDRRYEEKRKLERQNEIEEKRLRKTSLRKQENDKVDTFEKPLKKKQKRPKAIKKQKTGITKEQRPPVASGCFHICDTLIFEVYKIMGGNICDCVA